MAVQIQRKLSVFAFDPFVANKGSNRRIKTIVISLPTAMDAVDTSVLFCGPVGEYLEVIDYDPASAVFYEPINLNDPRVFLNNGLSPSEEDPRFHQQMVYAVAMNTISSFEQALGRVALWSPRAWSRDTDHPDRGYVQKLRIYPHALREANAYYDPNKKALLFGYFKAGNENKQLLPGSTVFTCLSQDIIVHETCHALLDGLHPHFAESSNVDVLAFHEAFADIVAIFQHFSQPEVLEDQISKTRGDLEKQSLLGELAQEFGQALGRGGALRNALGGYVKGEWTPHSPDNRRLDGVTHPHARGAVLVAAIFRAFLEIYKQRVADLIRIASNGSGVLRDGELDPDLTGRLAREAAKTARHFLQICIRALDYCPPVDLTFGDYLRALVTADRDLFADDKLGYRSAIIESFVAWGIVPDQMQIVTENTLIWPTLADAAADQNIDLGLFEGNLGRLLSSPTDMMDELHSAAETKDRHQDTLGQLTREAEEIAEAISSGMKTFLQSKNDDRKLGKMSVEKVLSRNLLDMGLNADRKIQFLAQNFYARLFWLLITGLKEPKLFKLLGINLMPDAPWSIRRSKTNNKPSVQVNSVRMAKRIGDRGMIEREYVVELIQSRNAYFDAETQKQADEGKLSSHVECDFRIRSGCTLLIDAKTFTIRRIIRSRATCDDDGALYRQRQFRLGRTSEPPNAFDASPSNSKGQAFASLHRDTTRGASK